MKKHIKEWLIIFLISAIVILISAYHAKNKADAKELHDLEIKMLTEQLKKCTNDIGESYVE